MGHADFGAVPGVKPFVGGVLGGGSLPLSGYVLGPLVLRAYAATPSFDLHLINPASATSMYTRIYTYLLHHIVHMNTTRQIHPHTFW